MEKNQSLYDSVSDSTDFSDELFGLCVKVVCGGVVDYLLKTEVRQQYLMSALLTFSGEVDGFDRHKLLELVSKSDP